MLVKFPFVDNGSTFTIAEDGQSALLHLAIRVTNHSMGFYMVLVEVPELANLQPEIPLEDEYYYDYYGTNTMIVNTDSANYPVSLCATIDTQRRIRQDGGIVYDIVIPRIIVPEGEIQ